MINNPPAPSGLGLSANVIPCAPAVRPIAHPTVPRGARAALSAPWERVPLRAEFQMRASVDSRALLTSPSDVPRTCCCCCAGWPSSQWPRPRLPVTLNAPRHPTSLPSRRRCDVVVSVYCAAFNDTNPVSRVCPFLFGWEGVVGSPRAVS